MSSYYDLSLDESMKLIDPLIRPAESQTSSLALSSDPSKTERVAFEAMQYVQRVVLFSDNYPERSEIVRDLAQDRYEQLESALTVVTSHVRSLCSEWQGKPEYLTKASEIIHQYRVGNCLEMAIVAEQYAYGQGIRAELYKIENGDHAICILNRDPLSQPGDYKNFGCDAWVVDPWASMCFRAMDSASNLKTFCRTGCYAGRKYPITQPFNEQYHRLALVCEVPREHLSEPIAESSPSISETSNTQSTKPRISKPRGLKHRALYVRKRKIFHGKHPIHSRIFSSRKCLKAPELQ